MDKMSKQHRRETKSLRSPAAAAEPASYLYVCKMREAASQRKSTLEELTFGAVSYTQAAAAAAREAATEMAAD